MNSRRSLKNTNEEEDMKITKIRRLMSFGPRACPDNRQERLF
jgi:hypothetical protein